MKILLIGLDKRTDCLYKIIKEKTEHEIKMNEVSELKGADTLILPLPYSRDGVYVTGTEIKLESLFAFRGKTVIAGMPNEEFKNRFENRGISVFDCNEDETFLYKNARITAEAAVCIMKKECEKAIYDTRVLILGFGRIAKHLSLILSPIAASVGIAARKESDRAFAASLGLMTYEVGDISFDFDVILNTVPAKIINRAEVPKNCKIIDLAGHSSIDGDFISALGLPSKYSPESAAAALFDCIKDKIRG